MKEHKKLLKTFPNTILNWDRLKNARQMPWKKEKDPYKIWLSEIILQQTRVEQGLKYYNNFIQAFPDVHSLAGAKDEQVYKLWEGLGYYNRCRNLIDAARYISDKLNGIFPDSYDEILKLKGIGPYTAAAIASFAYNLPYAVVDVNVFRVLARIFGISLSLDSPRAWTVFSQLANELIDKENPALYNQAIMDFGAVICKPVLPLCNECDFMKTCSAFLTGNVTSLPVKSRKITLKKRWFYYLVLETGNLVAIHRRMNKDIWHNLFEYLLIEAGEETDWKWILRQAEKKGFLQRNRYDIASISKIYNQKLSHQLIIGQFIKVRIRRKMKVYNDLIWCSKNRVSDYAFPKIINQFQQEKNME